MKKLELFHGSKKPLVVKNERSKRYGVPVLFFTTEPRLAEMYAGSNGELCSVNLVPDIEIDFKNKVSHSSQFRNLVFQMSKEGHDVVAVTNVFDRPNDSFPLESSTIVMVFDFEKLDI